MNTAEIEVKDAEQKALAAQALADFASREGLTLSPTAQPTEAAATEGPARVMGPRNTTNS
jgi:hypothetical protein